jgi:hypothetical protein
MNIIRENNMLENRKSDLYKVIVKLKKIIDFDIKKEKINNALKHLSCLSKIEWSYYYTYRDDDIEIYINKLSRLIFGQQGTYEPKETHVVLIDSLSWDYHGLTQQYLRAMMSLNMNIMYVIINERFNNKLILKELKDYNNSTVIHISNKNIEQQIMLLHKEIMSFRPSEIFLHSLDILDSIVMKSISSSIKFRIDFGDHYYWPGIDATDYIIGFRDWGLALCNLIKKVNKSKLLVLPFYPILNDINDFNGLPSITNGKVLIFSGGSAYKVIDNNMTFFKLMHRIVNENDNVIILFACMGNDSLLRKYIDNNNLQNKIILMNFRNDLGNFIEHIDIYLNTYPLGGGLMVQYAAEKSIPILSIRSNETIEYHDFKELGYSYQTEYNDIEEFHQEANKLINNKEYRITIGKLVHQYVPTKEQFNKSFSNIFYKNESNNYIKKDLIKYKFEESRKHLYDSSLKLNLSTLSRILCRTFYFKVLIYFPYKIILDGCFDYLIQKIIKNKMNSVNF